MKLPWKKKDERIKQLQSEKKQLEDRIGELEDELESMEERYEAEKERRSELARKKQQAEEKLNRLEDREAKKMLMEIPVKGSWTALSSRKHTSCSRGSTPWNRRRTTC
jgi:chromosome segregation ATPase